jgi:hypothetical protein
VGFALMVGERHPDIARARLKHGREAIAQHGPTRSVALVWKFLALQPQHLQGAVLEAKFVAPMPTYLPSWVPYAVPTRTGTQSIGSTRIMPVAGSMHPLDQRHERGRAIHHCGIHHLPAPELGSRGWR